MHMQNPDRGKRREDHRNDENSDVGATPADSGECPCDDEPPDASAGDDPELAALLHGDRLATLGAGAAVVLHELNNMLCPVTANAEILHRHADLVCARLVAFSPTGEDGDRRIRTLAENLPQMAKDILDAGNRMRALLGTLRPYGRKRRQDHASCRIESAVAGAVGVFRMRAHETVPVHVRIQPDLPEAPMPGLELEQILVNLLVNAEQAMSSDGSVFISASMSGDSAIVIRVRDTGPGISDEMMASLWRPFVTSGKSNGTGLGLYLCKRTLESRKGSISCTNHPEGGAEFTVHLPSSVS